MDKVDFSASSLIPTALQRSMKQEARKAGSKGGRKTVFSGLLDNYVSSGGELGALREFAPSEQALTELMDEVHSAGNELIDRPFHDEILRYKRAVRDFIHYVVENAFELEKSQTRRKGKVKSYAQIQVIDRKLEELAAAILSGQTTQLERVSKLDEIKGLLVDLTIQGVIRERDE